MGAKDRRVDAYIAKSPDFAKPILKELRRAVHAACPPVAETMKWSFPHFMYNGMLCSMAAFKQHCAFGFWKGSLVLGPVAKEGMGHLGKIASLKDLPPKNVLARYIKKACELNDAGVKVMRQTKPRPALRTPKDFAAALARNAAARAAFQAFSPSHKRDYVQWITEAKTETTRSKRLQTALAWIAKGKSRNWKYER